MSLLRVLSVGGVILLAVGARSQMGPQGARQRPMMTAVVSSTYPKDSRGEAVYESRTVTHQDDGSGPVYQFPVVMQRAVKDAEYPESMRRKLENGWVQVRGVVAENGAFIDLSVVKSSDPGFEENALKAAKTYRFRPATLDGKPVATMLTTEFTFNISKR